MCTLPEAPADRERKLDSRRLAMSQVISRQPFAVLGAAALLAFAVSCPRASVAEAAKPPPTRIAVFAFELEDASPQAAYLGGSGSVAATMAEVSRAARTELAQSGRYRVIDASTLDTKRVAGKGLRNCGGCEAALALQLGAEQSLLGVVVKATQTDYYVVVQIRDARTGKLLDQQEANFAGGQEGWPSGVRMLIRHQVLAIPPSS
jgi:curli biogenesis system outer membrane secretion channel CsgG